MAPRKTRAWVLAKPPMGPITGDTFTLTTLDLPSLAHGQVFLRTVYLSNDPAQRNWIQRDADPARAYLEPVRPGQIMASLAICTVVDSRSDLWKAGQLVRCSAGWVEFLVMHESKITDVLLLPGHSPTISLGALGGPALTAWFGLRDICDVKPEHCVLVSGAAGATGSMAVQIAKKMLGSKRVIGIAGGASKCAYVKSIGADDCIDYKTLDFPQRLVSATEGYVDRFLDMVGGDILAAALPRVKRFGTVAIVGAISTYNDPFATRLTSWHEVIMNRLTLRGFIVTDFAPRFPEALDMLSEAVLDGTLVVDGGETLREVSFEQVPEVWRGLFNGTNTGKLVTKIVS